MNASKKSQLGVSLLEVMLVLAIGGAILFLSIQQYQSYRRDADMIQVQANVNAIFQAMGAYYRSQCYGTTDPTATINPTTFGALNPEGGVSLSSSFPVNIQTALIDGGYLTSSALPLSPLVNASGAGTRGYVAQFNPQTVDRKVCQDTACTPANMATVGTIVIWKAQVAVQLQNPGEQKQYLNLLAGDCLSSSSGTTVTPCTSGGGSGNFVVWQRLPSAANTNVKSDYWVTIPTVNQFKQMYTTIPVTQLIDATGSGSYTQYYLCGN